MALTHAPSLTLRRRCSKAVALSRACVLRQPGVCCHGIPRAFICLSGVTAMLSAAVRKA